MAESQRVLGARSLDEVIEAFEAAQARDGHAELDAFLPRSDHPDYPAILCELVRVDLEYRWGRGRPALLEEYQARFPELFGDPARAREVAFEEYRLRLQAGDSPSPREYRQRFGGTAIDWPAPAIEEDETGVAAEEQGSGSAASPTGTAFRARRPDSPKEARPGMDSAAVTREQAEVFEALGRDDPATARRLARGLVALPEAGERFLGFRLRRELGRGAFGKVFLAEQERMAGRLVALKVTADALGETHALAQLQHTNVVPIYSVHRGGPLQALCMPYFGSATLADVIAGLDGGRTLPDSGQGLVSTLDDRKGSHASPPRDGAPPTSSGDPAPGSEAPEVGGSRPTAQIERLRHSSYVDAVLWLGLRLAEGLAHAHERGILHRDLKPANVLFTDDGEPMLLDFNLAADLKLREPASAALVGGTLPYMAPEHLEAFRGGPREPDARSDLFSLGVILFELLTGRLPFPVRRGPALAILPPMIGDRRKPLPDLRSANRLASPAVAAIIRRCLEPDPARRYQLASHLAEDLRRQIDHRPLLHTREPSRRERLGKWARRHPRLTSATSVTLTSLGLIAMLAGALVARQNRLDRLEARDSLARLGSEVRMAEFLLGSPESAPAKLVEGLALCREAAGRYGAAEDPRWMLRRLASALPPEDRGRLRRSMGELLGLWAQGETWRAEGAGAAEKRVRIARAGSLLDRAEAAFGPGASPAVLRLVRSDLARVEGRSEAASRLRREAAAVPLRTARERLLLVPDRLGSGRDREALALAEEASRLDPTDPLGWLLRGFCLARLSRTARAIECYSVGIGLQPGFDWAYLDRGVLALEDRDFDRAVEDFDRVLARRPDLVEARMNRALARLGRGDARGAISDLDLLLMRPDAPTRAYFIRARAREALGQPDQAARDRRLGLSRPPGDELSWVTRGLNRLPDNPAGAVADFDAALRLNSRSLWALQNKASVLSESLGRVEEAVSCLDVALARHPESVPALAGRGVLLARLGRRDDALRDASGCLALDDSADTLYRVGCMYALTAKTHPEDAAEAMRLLARAVRLDPAWLRQIPLDRDLDPLRVRPEFRRMVEALTVIFP